MMTTFYGVIALGLLVVVHELGHFLAAKYFGVAVLEFSVGFGKKLWRRKIGETTYALGVIPLGGYVRMAGDDPHLLEEDSATQQSSSNTQPQQVEPAQQKATLNNSLLEGLDLSEQEYKNLLQDRSRWFLSQGFWPRAIIVFAGPLANIVFALLLSFALHIVYGKPDVTTIGGKPVLGEVVPNYPADRAGLKAGDKVLTIDGTAIKSWEELAKTISNSGGKELKFIIQRTDADNNGELVSKEIVVAATLDNAELTALDEKRPGEKIEQRHMIGISASFDRVPVGVWEAAAIAPRHVWFIAKMTVKSLLALVSGVISPKHIAGPIFIFGEAARTAERGFDSLFTFLIVLNISLAIFNLLPIPVLDGGHLLFFILGAIKGEPVSLKVQHLASQVGMVLLLALMLFAVSNDIMRMLL